MERNRLFLAVKNFPLPELLLVPFYSIARYFWHCGYAFAGSRKGRRVPAEKAIPPDISGVSLRGHLELLARFPDFVAATPQDETTASPRDNFAV